MSVTSGIQMFNQIHGRADHREIGVDPLLAFTASTAQENEDKATSQVKYPDHYRQGTSPYDVARSMYGPEGLLKFVTINCVKYVSRYPHKYAGDRDKQLADLVKARQSLDTAIELHKEIYGNGIVRHG